MNQVMKSMMQFLEQNLILLQDLDHRKIFRFLQLQRENQIMNQKIIEIMIGKRVAHLETTNKEVPLVARMVDKDRDNMSVMDLLVEIIKVKVKAVVRMVEVEEEEEEEDTDKTVIAMASGVETDAEMVMGTEEEAMVVEMMVKMEADENFKTADEAMPEERVEEMAMNAHREITDLMIVISVVVVSMTPLIGLRHREVKQTGRPRPPLPPLLQSDLNSNCLSGQRRRTPLELLFPLIARYSVMPSHEMKKSLWYVFSLIPIHL